MSTERHTAEDVIAALESLSKRDRDAVLAHLVDDARLRHDLMDLALIAERAGEPSRPLSDYLADKRKA